MAKIVLQSIIDSIASRVDGSITIKVTTNELEPQKAGELFSLRGKFCKVLFSDTNITTLEAEAIDSTKLVSGKKIKTESQRLRAVLYRLNEQNGGDTDNFETFYKSEMERIIEHYRAKLD